ncbi:MAG: insulinase family protein [Alphaproteobacteria bacterium]
MTVFATIARPLVVALGLGLGLELAVAAPVAAKVFDPETFTLANGMQVVVIPNHRLPLVTQMVWYKVGAADEPPGRSGLAHMLEHMMFKGTGQVPPGEFSKIVARNGGRDNAFTSSDYTGYYQTIAADRLELVMKMEADRMVNLRLDPETFRTERDVVREERRSRTDNEPSALLNERMDAALWMLHPYRNPIIGWDHELRELTRDQALDFYHRHYAPNNAVLLVAGDVTVETLKPLAEKYYGVLPRRDVPPRARIRDLPPRADVVIEMRHPDVQQPSWSRQYMAPSYNFDQGHPTWPYALQVLSEVLGGGTTSRLYQSLVVNRKLAASAGSSYGSSAVDLGTFSVHASPNPGVPIAEVQALLEAELARLLKDGVSDSEVARARKRLVASVAYARDSLSTGARVLGAALSTGQTVADVEAWPDRINAVTAAEVTAAARGVLGSGPHVSGLLLPETTAVSAIPAAEATGRTP